MAGLGNLSPFFENPLFAQTIREIPVPAQFIGQRFLPAEDTYDIDFYDTSITRQQDMANLVDSGAELPLTDRDPVRTVKGEIADIGQSYIVSKKELAALMDKGNVAKKELAAAQLLKKTALIKANIDARIEWMRWQALGTGKLVYNKDGVILGADFDIPESNLVTPGVKWDDTTPTIIEDYEGWVEAYVTLNGFTPDTFVTSTKVMNAVVNNPTVRLAITGLSGKYVTIAELNTFLTARNLPKMETFDTLVTYRDVHTGSTRVTQRLLSDSKGIFLKEGGMIGSQLMGPTYENNMDPGVFARTFTMERPVREVIEVVAASFPKITEPQYIKIADVLSA